MEANSCHYTELSTVLTEKNEANEERIFVKTKKKGCELLA